MVFPLLLPVPLGKLSETQKAKVMQTQLFLHSDAKRKSLLVRSMPPLHQPALGRLFCREPGSQ